MKDLSKQKLHSNFYKCASGRQWRISSSLCICINSVSSGAPRNLGESSELVKQIHGIALFSRQAFMAFIDINSIFTLVSSVKGRKSFGLLTSCCDCSTMPWHNICHNLPFKLALPFLFQRFVVFQASCVTMQRGTRIPCKALTAVILYLRLINYGRYRSSQLCHEEIEDRYYCLWHLCSK